MSPRKYFDLTYAAAKRRDEFALDKLMNDEWRTIDFVYHGKTIAAKLEREGEREVVDWLWDTFHVNLDLVVVEAIKTKQHERAKLLLSKGASLQSALYAYASLNDDESVNRLLGNIQYVPILNKITQGYAARGEHDKVNDYINQGAGSNAAAIGYAYTHNHAYVNQLVAAGRADFGAVIGYAASGQLHKIKELLAGLYTRHNYTKLKDIAIAYLISSGYFSEAKELARKTYTSLSFANSYASAGEMSQYYFHQMGSPTPHSVIGFSKNGCFEHPRRLMQLLVWTRNEALREIILEEYRKENDYDEEVVTRIGTQAKSLRLLSDYYGIPYYESANLSTEDLTYLLAHSQSIYTWLLQGEKAVALLGLPGEIFTEISRHILGVSEQSAHMAIRSSRDHIYYAAKHSIDGVYKNSWTACLFGSCLGYANTRKRLIADLKESTAKRYGFE